MCKRWENASGSLRPASSHLEAGGKLLSKTDSPQNDDEAEEMRKIPYREAVGALIWEQTMARSDLSHAAHTLAKFSVNPGPAHWKEARKALKYLWRTKIWYGGKPGGDIKLSAWIDTNYDTFPDTRCSVSEQGSHQLVFSCVEGDTVASFESEYVALSEMVNELSQLGQVKEFMIFPVDENVKIHEDNEGVIKMTRIASVVRGRCTKT